MPINVWKSSNGGWESSRRVRTLRVGLGGAFWLLRAGIACAQEPRPPVPCIGQRIDDIIIVSTAPTVAALQGLPALAALARSIHTPTQPEVIEQFLVFAGREP